METYALPACPGLQPVCRITQEQVRSHVLCESPLAKSEASHRLTIRLLVVLTVEIAVLFPGPTGYGGWLLQIGVSSNWRGTLVRILGESPGSRRRKECSKTQPLLHRVQAAWMSGGEEIFVAVLVDRDCQPVLRYNTLTRHLQGVGRLVPTSISQNRDISPPITRNTPVLE